MRPEWIALIIFAVFATVATIVLAGQGLAQIISRSSAVLAAVRALGAGLPRPPRWRPACPDCCRYSAARSWPQPVPSPCRHSRRWGPVRRFDPDRGIHADWLVLGIGTLLLLVILLGLLAVLAVRSTRPWPRPSTRSSAIARGTARAGLRPPQW